MSLYVSEKDLHVSSLAKDKAVMEKHMQAYREE